MARVAALPLGPFRVFLPIRTDGAKVAYSTTNSRSDNFQLALVSMNGVTPTTMETGEKTLYFELRDRAWVRR